MTGRGEHAAAQHVVLTTRRAGLIKAAAIRGGRPLTGRVEVKGAKNLATKAMVAALLGETVSRAEAG